MCPHTADNESISVTGTANRYGDVVTNVKKMKNQYTKANIEAARLANITSHSSPYSFNMPMSINMPAHSPSGANIFITPIAAANA
jgi:hypothetical protein